MQTFTIETIPFIVETLIKKVAEGGYSGISLSGNLGAGKTTITQEIARQFGVKEKVVSPTFILMKCYQLHHPLWNRLVHIDAYRIEQEHEAKRLGYESMNISGDFWCVEWPEHLHTHVPPHLLPIKLEYVDETTRGIIGL
jgi:tRNA threonylcarbamoyladenosine biosynthesis protein TsaE